jgi:hypothetical protein
MPYIARADALRSQETDANISAVSSRQAIRANAIVTAALRRVCELLGKVRLGAVRLDSAACPALIGRLQLSARFCRSV